MTALLHKYRQWILTLPFVIIGLIVPLLIYLSGEMRFQGTWCAAISLMILIAAYGLLEARDLTLSDTRIKQSLENEARLWQSRFEAVQNKLTEEREESRGYSQTLEEEILSLRSLAKAIHLESLSAPPEPRIMPPQWVVMRDHKATGEPPPKAKGARISLKDLRR